MGKIALIVGATGATGSHLTEILLGSTAYDKVLSFVRKETGRKHPKLLEYLIDFDTPESFKELVKGDDFFCCLGSTIKKAGSQEAFAKVDLEYPLQFAAFAKENGVNKFLIISAIGANAQSKIFYSRIKGELETRLKSYEFGATSIFRPSLIVGKRNEFRLGERLVTILMRVISPLLVGRCRKYRAITGENLARGIYIVAQKTATGQQVFESDKIARFAKEYSENM